jgi:nitroimidazol reductase NimA-like FMN-containing flavoprotein (pyridoxamine 5'-phosphate oxidase superfamily)
MRRKDREIVDKESLRAILENADACRLAFARGDMPYIVTMNFGFEWEGAFPVLYFHSAREGRKLEMMRANPRVCFELDVDHELTRGPAPCDWGMKYASLVGYGELRELADEGERKSGLDLVMSKYGWNGEADYRAGPVMATAVLRLDVDELSGKRRS